MVNFIFFVLSLSAFSISVITGIFLHTQKTKFFYNENKKKAKIFLLLSISFMFIMIPVQIGLFPTELGIFLVFILFLSTFIYKFFSRKIKYKNTIKETLRLIECNNDFSCMAHEIDNIIEQINLNNEINKKELKNLNNMLIEKRDDFLNKIKQYKVVLE